MFKWCAAYNGNEAGYCSKSPLPHVRAASKSSGGGSPAAACIRRASCQHPRTTFGRYGKMFGTACPNPLLRFTMMRPSG